MSSAVRAVSRAALVLSSLLAGCSVSTSGPLPLPVFSHIHNDRRATAAHQAQGAMTEYGKNTPAMYSAMTANVELFKSNEDATVSQFGAINLQQLVTDLPGMTKREFDKRANDHLAAAQALDAGIILQMSQELSAINAAPGSLNTLGKAVTAAKQRVDDAKQNVTQWNEQVAFFQLAFQSLPDSNLSKSGTLSLLKDPDQFKSAAGKAAATQFTYVDADGKTQPLTVGQFAKDKFQGVAADAFNGDISNAIVSAPGAGLTIANLGANFAELEQQRAQIQLAQARNLLELLEKTWIQLAVAESLLAEIENPSTGFLYTAKTQDELLFNAIEHEAQAKSGTPIGRRFATANILMFVREEAIAESILSRVRTLAPLAIARLDHENSILISNINDREYQSLIQSGVAGLVAYHDGGLTAQDVANVINFAQAVGVGVISGRVK